MPFDFEAIKKKYSHDTNSKIFVGNADEIRSLIAAFEEKQVALEEMSKELKMDNEMIKELKKDLKAKHKISNDKKAPYDDPND